LLPSLFVDQDWLALPGSGRRFARHDRSIGGSAGTGMSQTDGLTPTNHPIVWSAIRLIRTISQLEERANAVVGMQNAGLG
jgi:hypothetical protein